MRCQTQNPITDRIFGTRQDGRGIDVRAAARMVTVCRRLLGKRMTCQLAWHHPVQRAWHAAAMAVERLHRWAEPGLVPASYRPSYVVAVVRVR